MSANKRSTDIGTLIKAIANAKDAEENRQLQRYGLTAMQMHVLLYLHDADNFEAPLKELERGLRVTQSTMAKLVRNLVREKGIVTYEEDPNDRRVKKVKLAPSALALCKASEHIVTDMEAQLCEGLSADETEKLRRQLLRMYASFDQASGKKVQKK